MPNVNLMTLRLGEGSKTIRVRNQDRNKLIIKQKEPGFIPGSFLS